MSISQYRAFAVGVGANALPYSAYAALTSLINQGFQTGVAESNQFNALMRQCSVPAATLAQFAATYGTSDILDDGNLFVSQLAIAIQAVISGSPQKRVTGEVAMFLLGAAPPGWLALQGQNVSRTGATAALFALWGTSYGVGDGVSTFGVPDTRGVFPRGLDAGRGLDPGRGLGTFQDYATAIPKNADNDNDRIDYLRNPTTLSSATSPSTAGFARVSKPGESVTNNSGVDSGGAGYEPDLLNVVKGDRETRPVNVAFLLCVKL